MTGKLTDATFESYLPLSGDRLFGKTAIVTGGGSSGDLMGTGSAMCVLFAAQGANVVIVDSDGARAKHTERLIQGMDGSVRTVLCDVRLFDECCEAVRIAKQEFGGLHILVNNAGVARTGGVASVSEADWNLVIDVNMKGTMNMTRAAHAELAGQRGSSVVNISSIASQRGFGAIAYAGSKGGIVSMTKDMACTMGTYGIRANCLIPGSVTTPMVGGMANEAGRAAAKSATLLGQEGTAWDVAWAALFFASDESRWITATTLNVDGGSDAYPGARPAR